MCQARHRHRRVAPSPRLYHPRGKINRSTWQSQVIRCSGQKLRSLIPDCCRISLRGNRRKTLLEPFGLIRYYTDYWGAYTRHLDPDVHCPGKRNTQKIERKHLTLRTRIKRLVRKTICFSKTTQMHDIVIGLFVNRYAFGRAV